MRLNDSLELTYCTNIHPASGWRAVSESLARYGPALKASLSPAAPFGLGLRLSAAEAAELSQPARLKEFQEFLAAQGLYVALINGFPYGSFHGSPLKADVFAPDWRTRERLDYTTNLASILATLMPEWTEGGVSTAPLSYKEWMKDPGDPGWEPVLSHVLACAESMARLRQETGRYVHLDIEPEPGGLIETTQEFIQFFERLLRFAPAGKERILRGHVTVCFDICHMAVEFEDPAQSIAALESAGIRVGRVQVSSALRVPVPRQPAELKRLRAALGGFADPVYLHQVIGRTPDGATQKFADLPVALDCLEQASGNEWRVHFHVPLFSRDYAAFSSTQDVILKTFDLLASRPITRHLEIETYTWSVLPPPLKEDLRASIEREFRWVLEHLCVRR